MPQKVKIVSPRVPLRPYPASPSRAQNEIRSAQSLRTFRSASTARLELLVVFVAVFALVLGEAARRPVRLRRIAPARAVQRRDVLQRDQDVPVQLDVGDVLEIAVGGQDTFLVFAAEEGDLDLLALVLGRV